MTVFGLLSSVAGFIKVRYLADKAVIDNAFFRMHYKTTSAFLFAACIIINANGLIGDPIHCVQKDIESHVMNTYCWITSTFSLFNQTDDPAISPHPGLGNPEGQETRYHNYYQWVPFMLFFQGVLFYVPHWLWKNWEEGKIRMVSEGIRGATVGPKAHREERVNRLVQYFTNTLHMHNHYAAGYFFCEVLNFINVIGNIFFIDKFLGGTFLTYGSDVLRFNQQQQSQRVDPMIQIFPRVTKCTFNKFGKSGSLENYDAICILALNILNEKIYIFLWFWLIFLAVCSGLALVYSALMIVLPGVREAILKKRFRFGSPAGVSSLIRKTQVGDFLFLHLLGQNMDLRVFGEVLDELSTRLMLGNNLPSAPSSLELSPIYPDKLRSDQVLFGKETPT